MAIVPRAASPAPNVIDRARIGPTAARPEYRHRGEGEGQQDVDRRFLGLLDSILNADAPAQV